MEIVLLLQHIDENDEGWKRENMSHLAALFLERHIVKGSREFCVTF